MMRTEIDPKIAWGVIIALLIVVGAIYYFFFRTPSGELSAKEAKLGKPVRPGELPPGTPPPPWAPPPDTLQQGQPQPAPSNPR
jgi:hypothetical protein